MDRITFPVWSRENSLLQTICLVNVFLSSVCKWLLTNFSLMRLLFDPVWWIGCEKRYFSLCSGGFLVNVLLFYCLVVDIYSAWSPKIYLHCFYFLDYLRGKDLWEFEMATKTNQSVEILECISMNSILLPTCNLKALSVKGIQDLLHEWHTDNLKQLDFILKPIKTW